MKWDWDDTVFLFMLVVGFLVFFFMGLVDGGVYSLENAGMMLSGAYLCWLIVFFLSKVSGWDYGIGKGED